MQLELPNLSGPAEASTRSITAPRRVYVNRDLKLSNIDWIGFDMDYTLAIYHQDEMDRLSIEATLDKL
ncbi:MAG: 5'-nucleotidase, partial [Myxococcales bacterium]|nr:5'-nucleotidase [Myxococcales bacterium]